MGFFGILLIVSLAAAASLAVAGLIIALCSKNKGEAEGSSGSVTENAADLNDRFNRARYQDKDGE